MAERTLPPLSPVTLMRQLGLEPDPSLYHTSPQPVSDQEVAACRSANAVPTPNPMALRGYGEAL